MQTESKPDEVTKCGYCGERIRPSGPGDGIDEADREFYAWVGTDGGGALCDMTPVHMPKTAEDGALYIVIVEDRHEDVEALPFSTEERAIKAAREHAGDMALPDDVDPECVDHVPGEQELTPDMRKDGWVLYLVYSIEGDSVHVVRRTVDAKL